MLSFSAMMLFPPLSFRKQILFGLTCLTIGISDIFEYMKLINKALIFPIKLYQKIISPLLGNNCRYNPTCSHYMIQAIEEWGPIKGIFLGIKRIGRCHPWGGFGLDPVPKRENPNKSKEENI